MNTKGADKRSVLTRESTFFIKAQSVGLSALAIDWCVSNGVFWLSDVSKLATGSGLCAGGVTSFLLNRFWTYESTLERSQDQLKRFLLVWAGSFILNMMSTELLFNIVELPYTLSRLFSAVAVSVIFNFLMNRFFVFGKGSRLLNVKNENNAEVCIEGKAQEQNFNRSGDA